MTSADGLTRTRAALAAAAADPAAWPAALAEVTRLFAAAGATLEVMNGAGNRHAFFRGHGVPEDDVALYLRHYAAINPRAPFCGRLPAGGIGYDLAFMTEAEMDRHPFYAEFLTRANLRYFAAGILARGPDEVRTLVVHHAPRQGHVETADLALLRRLMPHLRDALDTTMRLGEATALHRALASGFDWLSDGVAVVTADAVILEANAAFAAMLRTGAGLRAGGRALEIAAPEARRRLAAGLATIAGGGAGSDFAVPRPDGALPLVVSLRPLDRPRAYDGVVAPAIALVFVHDPQTAQPAAATVLRQVFGLTEAEADLAVALQAGATPAGHALTRGVSINTVYTHLRRLKAKTGCKRQTELVAKLNELRAPVRPA